MKYRIVVYRDRKREFRWRILHRNGRIVADSAEGYVRRASCVRSVKNLAKALSGAKIVFDA